MKIQNDLKNDEAFLKQLKNCTNKYFKLDDKQLLNKRLEIEKSLSNYNMMINVNTLNLSCADIGKYKEYLLQQILPIISFTTFISNLQIFFEFSNSIFSNLIYFYIMLLALNFFSIIKFFYYFSCNYN